MDFLEQYKKNKLINNLSIIWISLALALAINFTFLNPNFDSKNLKANILENQKKENLGDIYLEKENNKIVLKTNWDIKNISSLSLSLVYNPENIEIWEITPRLNSEIDIIANEDWIKTFIINYKDNYNIKAWEKIFSFDYTKKSQKTENINIINSNFTNSNWQTFELTNNWISF